MKKHITILTALLFICVGVQAQIYDSLCHRNVGWYDIDLRNMIAMRDGSILANVQLHDVDEEGNYLADKGNRLLKIARDNGLSVVDSVFVEDDMMYNFLLAENPFGDDYVYAKMFNDYDLNQTFLRISFFDENLDFHPEKEVVVHISDSLMANRFLNPFMDCHGDIVYFYSLNGDDNFRFIRIGLDGTVKSKAKYPFSEMPGNLGGYYFNVFNESPLEYVVCLQDHDGHQFNGNYYVMDTLFNIKEYFCPPIDFISDFGWDISSWMKMTEGEDGSFLYADNFHCINPNYSGVCVANIKHNSHELTEKVLFRTMPYIEHFGCAFPIGLEKAYDGYFYFAYNTQDAIGAALGYPGHVSVVKLDCNLNVVWQRFCLEPIGTCHEGKRMALLDDGGIAIGGIYSGYRDANGNLNPPTLFFLSFTDEGWSTPEMEPYIRPYLIYPNPVKDRLSIHISPDVKLESIELYDVSGRCVASSRTAEMDVANLPAGQYVARITLEGGKTYTDKIVKE